MGHSDFNTQATRILEISLIAPEDTCSTYYLLDHGAFSSNRTLHSTLTGLWAAVQFILPATILFFCTTRLVQALRESSRIQRQYWTVIRATTGMMASQTGSEKGRRLTGTLVAIVIFFLVLVTPSEVLNLCYYVVRHDNAPSFELALVVANVLQTANFALNFVLYCACNSQFRATWKHLAPGLIWHHLAPALTWKHLTPALTWKHLASALTTSFAAAKTYNIVLSTRITRRCWQRQASSNSEELEYGMKVDSITWKHLEHLVFIDAHTASRLSMLENRRYTENR